MEVEVLDPAAPERSRLTWPPAVRACVCVWSGNSWVRLTTATNSCSRLCRWSASRRCASHVRWKRGCWRRRTAWWTRCASWRSPVTHRPDSSRRSRRYEPSSSPQKWGDDISTRVVTHPAPRFSTPHSIIPYTLYIHSHASALYSWHFWLLICPLVS